MPFHFIISSFHHTNNCSTTISAALCSCIPMPKMTSSGRFWSLLYVVFVVMMPVSMSESGVYGDGMVDGNSNCPLPYWDNAAMDVLVIAGRSDYQFNDTDIASIPWVHDDDGNVLNVPTVNCKQFVGGHPRRRVVMLLIGAISRPLVEAKYPLLMNFSRQDHRAFHFKNHHTIHSGITLRQIRRRCTREFPEPPKALQLLLSGYTRLSVSAVTRLYTPMTSASRLRSLGH